MKVSVVIFVVSLFASGFAAESQAPAAASTPESKAAVALPKMSLKIPKIDSKAVASANQKQTETGITQDCEAAVTRMKALYNTAQQSLGSLQQITQGQSTAEAAKVAAKALQGGSNSQILQNTRANMKFDTNAHAEFANSGSSIGTAMGAVAQIQQVPGASTQIIQTANEANIHLQNLRTAQFATYGACGSAVGATLSSNEQPGAGVPGGTQLVRCDPNGLASQMVTANAQQVQQPLQSTQQQQQQQGATQPQTLGQIQQAPAINSLGTPARL